MAEQRGRNAVSIFMRIGSGTLERVTRSAEKEFRNRSDWTEQALIRLIKNGLPEMVPTDLILEAWRKEGRTLFRIEEKVAAAVNEESERLELTVTDYVLIAIVARLWDEHEG